MADDVMFLANPYLSGLRRAPGMALAPSAPALPGFDVRPQALPPRQAAAMPEDDGFRPLSAADARMFLGASWQPGMAYRRNRLTGRIEAIDDPLLARAAPDQAPPAVPQVANDAANPPALTAGPSAPPAGAPPQRGFGRRLLDAAGDAGEAAWQGLNTGVNYAGTQIVKAASTALGTPRAASDGMFWLQKKTGIPPIVAFGPFGALAYTGRYAPTGEQISRGFFDATGAPEVKLEGIVPGGAIIDAGVQGLAAAPFTGGTSLPALMAGALTGAGAEAAGQLAQEYDRRNGTDWEVPVRIGGSRFNPPSPRWARSRPQQPAGR
jgi:hypothetical protein